MARALVLSVENGSKYENVIYNYWIKVQLEDGSCLLLFDDSVLELRSGVGKWINCSISLLESSELNEGDKCKDREQEIRGVFLDFPPCSPIKNEGQYLNFATNAGVFYIAQADLPNAKVGKPMRICEPRFNLLALSEN